MKVSIIVPTWNLVAKLKRCLRHLERYTDMGRVQLVVVDNGSDDETFKYVMENHFRDGEDVYVKLARNHGFAEASDIGASAADGELLMFLNNDLYIGEEGWLDDMIDELLGGAMVVGHKLLYPDNTVQHAGLFFNVQGIPIHLWRGVPSDHPYVVETKELTAVTGACMLVASDDFEKLGGFDTAYINGFEDIDLCMKAVSLGGRVVCCMDKVIYHDECSTPNRKQHESRNARLFVTRWFVPQGGSR